MDRKALLIGSPGTRGSEGHLGGVGRDLQNYTRFLESALGGGWYSYEITTLDDPSAVAVRSEIRSLSSADYSVVLFSGHGYYSAGLRSTILCLRNDEEMDSADLRAGAEKHTLILDCCRQVARTVLTEDAMMKMDAAARKFSNSSCRRFYDKEIESSPPGLVVLHACDIDEIANDDSRRGGYYAYSLIDAAESWGGRNKTDLTKYYDALSVVRGHDAASEAVKRLSRNSQNPQIEKPRSAPYFPLAVVAL